MVSGKNIFLPKLLQVWKAYVFLIHLQWVSSRQGNFLHKMSHFSSKILINVRGAVVPPDTRQSSCGALLLRMPAVGGRAVLWGQNQKALLAKKQCKAQGEISCPIYTNSLWEQACGNKLALLVGIVLEGTFHWSLGKPRPKKSVPQLL